MTEQTLRYARPRTGDIVKCIYDGAEDGPCEVMAVHKDARQIPIIFIIHKRTLIGEFLRSDKVQFVRHSR